MWVPEVKSILNSGALVSVITKLRQCLAMGIQYMAYPEPSHSEMFNIKVNSLNPSKKFEI